MWLCSAQLVLYIYYIGNTLQMWMYIFCNVSDHTFGILTNVRIDSEADLEADFNQQETKF